MEAYLDNSATTKVYDSVKDIMIKVMTEDYGNPSSLHMRGLEAEKYIKQAREDIASILKCQEKEIFFTSGGTESNNMAVIGAAMANRRKGNHIITTAIEHPSVLAPLEFLENQGFRVTRIGVDENGVISADDVKEAICDDTILISIMYINNEIGSIQPIDEVADIIATKNPDIIFHVDAVQAFGKLKIYPKRQHIDLLSVSGHKIHGPKGVGFLYVKDKIKVSPVIYGGGQQKGMRSGTENVPGIAGLSVACVESYRNFNEKIQKITELKDYFTDSISKLDGIRINSRKGNDGAPHIVSVSFEGVKSEVLLHALEDKEIYVSAGSACSSNKVAISNTLKGIGLPEKYLDSTLRFSFSEYTTKEELDYTIKQIEGMLDMLRIYKHS
ncbi:MAG: cysteine desulfurase [Lachnospiraceae bacterium]|nr:cysteine desulfurase [Lachnospiraceae bacterium]MDE6233759.1 cysteine desulfurase [Lachnospiraceae bacterium]MDE6253754.1 cysteine desulfurase [Lachnospiraceae bacterium]